MGQRDNTEIPLMVAGAATSATKQWPGGDGVFNCVGTWDGATATLQFLTANGTTYLACGSDTTLTANGAGVFSLPACVLRVLIASAGAGTTLTASVERYDTA